MQWNQQFQCNRDLVQMGPGCMTQYSTFAMFLIELGFPGCMTALIIYS